jgi:hypothetical protein
VAELTWRKSSHSGSGDQCVEIAVLPEDRLAIRDSKHPELPSLTLNRSGFAKFVHALSD